MFVYKNSFKIKEWFASKMHAEAKAYRMYIAFDQNDDYSTVVEDGCVFAQGNIVAETEKAYKITFCTNSDNNKDFTAWVPKSVVAEVCDLEKVSA